MQMQPVTMAGTVMVEALGVLADIQVFLRLTLHTLTMAAVAEVEFFLESVVKITLQVQALQMAGVAPLVVLVTVVPRVVTVVMLVVVAAGVLVVEAEMDLVGLVERLYQEVIQKVLGVAQYTEVRKSKLY